MMLAGNVVGKPNEISFDVMMVSSYIELHAIVVLCIFHVHRLAILGIGSRQCHMCEAISSISDTV
jgi:hypothetical protein